MKLPYQQAFVLWDLTIVFKKLVRTGGTVDVAKLDITAGNVRNRVANGRIFPVHDGHYFTVFSHHIFWPIVTVKQYRLTYKLGF